jgi:hypothetical protein
MESRLTRVEAKKLGLPKCYGSLCKKHPELDGYRWVSGACIQCARDYVNNSRKRNLEKTKAHRKQASERLKLNPVQVEKKKIRNKLYREKNKERIYATKLDWNKRNPDKIAQHKITAKGKYKAQKNADTAIRRAAMRKRTPKWLDIVDHAEIEFTYIYCAALRSCGLDYHVDHIIPLQGKAVSGLHVPYNLQVIPAEVNLKKGNRSGQFKIPVS